MAASPTVQQPQETWATEISTGQKNWLLQELVSNRWTKRPAAAGDSNLQLPVFVIGSRRSMWETGTLLPLPHQLG